jgi:hypothetical protein
MNADKATFTDVDESISVQQPLTGITGFGGITRRGPVNDCSLLITSVKQFRKIFGGQINTSDFPALCERVLNKGGLLRINRIAHYTTIGDSSTLTALKTGLKNIDTTGGSPTHLFTAISKYPGADYLNLKVQILAPSNGLSSTGYFDMKVYILGDEANSLEWYKNLRIVGNPSVANSHFLDKPIAQSDLVTFGYLDLSGTSGQQTPAVATIDFTGATNGGSIVDADYTGDQGAKTGIFAFDAFDDMSQIAFPEISDAAVNNGIANYADGRADLEGLCHLDETNIDPNDIIADRAGITVDTKYASAFYGGVIDNNGKPLSEIADIVKSANYVDANVGPWISGAGLNRGIINNARGVINNFGSAGQYNERNQLAQAQVNPVVVGSGKIYLSSQLTLQVEDSLASFRNVARLIMYLKKALKPTLIKYLEEAPDPITFLSLYQEVEPFLSGLTSKRAFVKGAGVSGKGYDWNGDQFASSLSDLVVNNIDDLNNGDYKVQFVIYPQGVITGIDISIVISSSAGVSVSA